MCLHTINTTAQTKRKQVIHNFLKFTTMTLQLMIEVNEMTRNLPLCNLGNSFLLHSTKLSSTSGPTDGSLDNCLKTHSVKTYHHCLLRFPRAVGTGGQGSNPPLPEILADKLINYAHHITTRLLNFQTFLRPCPLLVPPLSSQNDDSSLFFRHWKNLWPPSNGQELDTTQSLQVQLTTRRI